MSYDQITLSEDSGVVTLTLNRPDTRNSMTPAMGEEIVHALGEVRRNPNARVLVVTGAGKAFSSGGDLNMLARDAGLDSDGPTIGTPRDFYARFLAVSQMPIPTIAAINGHAIGAGLCFALGCDLRIAASDAKMGMTFARLGIHPGMGATYFLPRLIGTSLACELFFTGRIFDAVEAERLGIVGRAVDRNSFSQAVSSLAGEIAASAPIAVRMVKKAIYRGTHHSLDEMLDFESLQQSVTFTTADAKEGIRAVRDKRAPKFEGK